MQLINDRRSYGWLSIILHWLAVAALLYMLWTGFNADWAEDAHNRAARVSFLALHLSFGLSVLLILLARVAASYAQVRPEAPRQSAPLKMLAGATHHLLLLTVLVQIVTGPLMVWVMARPLAVWNWFSIPSPFKEPNHDVHEILANVHDVGRWALVVLIGLHVLGALKHVLVDRDGSFQRILRPGPLKDAPRA